MAYPTKRSVELPEMHKKGLPENLEKLNTRNVLKCILKSFLCREIYYIVSLSQRPMHALSGCLLYLVGILVLHVHVYILSVPVSGLSLLVLLSTFQKYDSPCYYPRLNLTRWP